MSKNSLTSAPAPSRQVNSEILPAVFGLKILLSFSFIGRFLASLLLFAANSHAAETNAVLRQRMEFINKYCADCHDDPSAESGLDLVHQASDLGNPSVFETWVKVHDKVEAGEMPPKKKARPAPADLHAFVAGLTSDLSATEALRIRENGRAMKRRIASSEVRLAWAEMFRAATICPLWSRMGAATDRRPSSNSWSTIAQPCSRTCSRMSRRCSSCVTVCSVSGSSFTRVK